jgi:antitoxin (DNA-binding transcriptional repressor) of toxin-antitoxin stability system
MLVLSGIFIRIANKRKPMYSRVRSKFIAVAALVVLAVSGAPVAAVYAHQGSDDTGTSTSHTSTDDSHVTTTDTTPTTQRQERHNGGASTSSTSHAIPEAETEPEMGHDLSRRASQLLDDKRRGGGEHSTAVRQRVCNQRQGIIDERFARLGARAKAHLNAFDSIFAKLQKYQDTNKLDVANYDALVADATAKQTAAQAAVDALTALSSKRVDCSATDPAGTVATVKTAADDARTALQAYRASLKQLVNALLAAHKSATAADSQTDTSNTNTTSSVTTSGSN